MDVFSENDNEEEPHVSPISVMRELEKIFATGNDEELIEFIFVHDPGIVWGVLDDCRIPLFFHLLIEFLIESFDCESVLMRLFEYLHACDDRVATIVNTDDIERLEQCLLELSSETCTTVIRGKAIDLLQYMFSTRLEN